MDLVSGKLTPQKVSLAYGLCQCEATALLECVHDCIVNTVEIIYLW